MSRKRRRDTPGWVWEQALIDAYYEHRWRQALAPLADALHRWEAGEGDPEDVEPTGYLLGATWFLPFDRERCQWQMKRQPEAVSLLEREAHVLDL